MKEFESFSTSTKARDSDPESELDFDSRDKEELWERNDSPKSRPIFGSWIRGFTSLIVVGYSLIIVGDLCFDKKLASGSPFSDFCHFYSLSTARKKGFFFDDE